MARAKPVPSFSAPWGADGCGKPQRLVERVAESLHGAGTWPGSLVRGGGSPAATLYQPLH